MADEVTHQDIEDDEGGVVGDGGRLQGPGREHVRAVVEVSRRAVSAGPSRDARARGTLRFYG